MRTRTKILLGVVAFLGAASCKNNYDCECIWMKDRKAKSINHTIGKMKVGDAQFYCDQIQSDGYRAMSMQLTKDTLINCDLKKLN